MDEALTTGMLVSGLFFGWTIGSHYTGATMGMAYGTGLIRSRTVATVLIGKGLVDLDPNMSVGAKLAQGITAHVAAWVGYPTSMNQALLGGMAGAAGARGREPMSWRAVKEIVFSWFFTPVLAGVVSFGLYVVLSWLLQVR